MGLQRKIGEGIETQAWQPYQRGPCGFGKVGWDHAALGCFLLPRGLGSRRDFVWKKRGERTLAGGP